MSDKIALFDLDGTLAGYHKTLTRDLNKLRSPLEKPIVIDYNNMPDYIVERKRLITNQVGWWENLPKIYSGFEILEWCKEIGYRIQVCTKAPDSADNAWSEKVKWIKKNMFKQGEHRNITITSDKGLVYGRVLVDDYPKFAEAWLKHRPRGLVIMPKTPACKGYSHKNVIIYDGKNKVEVREALAKAFLRRKLEDY